MASLPPENATSLPWQAARAVTHPLHAQVAVFFTEHRQEIYSYLLTLGVRTAEAQEFTNDAFLKYYVALRDGQSIANPRAWVYAVAHNLAVNHHARAELFELPTPQAPTPESIALQRERISLLHRAVENLSPQQRACLHLRAEGFRYREIAQILGINSSTVGEFLQRAVKRLRKALHE